MDNGMIQPINSQEHATHTAGHLQAMAMRNTAYSPDPSPRVKRTVPYCDCDKRICPVCYPPKRHDWLDADDIRRLAGW